MTQNGVRITQTAHFYHKFTRQITLLDHASLIDLKDPEVFTSTHRAMEGTKNCTTLRLLNYPSISQDSVIKPGQIRCGEHTDYGSITLLFQDDMPGLEVSFCFILRHN